jgi:hypothetical protein
MSQTKAQLVDNLLAQVKGILGTETAPLYSFNADSTTGLYSPGAGQIALSAGGAKIVQYTASPSFLVSPFVETNVGGFTIQNNDFNSSSKFYIGLGLSSVILQAKEFFTDNYTRCDFNAFSFLFGTGLSSPLSTLYLNQDNQVAAGQRGTNLLPSFTFGLDVNTGLYSPGEDQLSLTTGGSDRLFIGSNGRVGIGTTAPGSTLEVAGNFQFSDGADRTIFLSETGRIFSIINNNSRGASASELRLMGRGANDFITFRINESERARIDSSGRLLVGTTQTINAGSWVNNAAGQNAFQQQIANVSWSQASIGLFSFETATNAAPQLSFNKSTSNTLGTFGSALGANTDIGSIVFSGSDGSKFVAGALIAGEVDGAGGTNDMPGRLIFSTTADGASSPTQRMLISSAGAVYLGSGTPGQTGITTYAEATNFRMYWNRAATASSGTALEFADGGVTRGSITYTNTATAYNTTSDYRLKENVTPLTGAINRLNQLQVHRFNFIADPDKTVDGFLAHEAQAVVPECVTGTKDDVDAEGNAVYQGIDQSKLVPLVVAALQEALTKIKTLEAKVAALEGV